MLKTLHFIPGHKDHLFNRIDGLGAYYYIFDLEDAVPANQKQQARRNVVAWFSDNPAENCFVRMNAAGSSDYDLDLDMLKNIKPAGLVIPKCENPDTIRQVLAKIGQSKPRPLIIALVESFAGLKNIDNTAASENVWAIGLGLEDMLSELIVDNNDATSLSDYIRLQVVVSAKANSKPVIDTISNEFKDMQLLKEECQKISAMGFDGKFSIHPNQIAVINEVFSPSPEALDWAKKIIKLSGTNDAPGYQNIDGQILTPPKLKKAQRILQAAGNSEKNK